jgi:hypothetical protein
MEKRGGIAVLGPRLPRGRLFYLHPRAACDVEKIASRPIAAAQLPIRLKRESHYFLDQLSTQIIPDGRFPVETLKQARQNVLTARLAHAASFLSTY